jgi:hypothetical protein
MGWFSEGLGRCDILAIVFDTKKKGSLFVLNFRVLLKSKSEENRPAENRITLW